MNPPFLESGRRILIIAEYYTDLVEVDLPQRCIGNQVFASGREGGECGEKEMLLPYVHALHDQHLAQPTGQATSELNFSHAHGLNQLTSCARTHDQCRFYVSGRNGRPRCFGCTIPPRKVSLSCVRPGPPKCGTVFI